MTPIYFVKTTESYEVSLVTINRQTSYDSVLRNHTRFADLGHDLPERTKLPYRTKNTASDKIVQAVHHCIAGYRIVLEKYRVRFFKTDMCLKDAEGMANSEKPLIRLLL